MFLDVTTVIILTCLATVMKYPNVYSFIKNTNITFKEGSAGDSSKKKKKNLKRALPRDIILRGKLP